MIQRVRKKIPIFLLIAGSKNCIAGKFCLDILLYFDFVENSFIISSYYKMIEVYIFVFTRYWPPAGEYQDSTPRALVFLSHGFSEHLGNFNQTINDNQL